MNKTEVLALHTKICNANVPMAVFDTKNGIRVTKLNTDLFDKAFYKMPRSLVGVYDDECLVDWLEYDLEHMLEYELKKQGEKDECNV